MIDGAWDGDLKNFSLRTWNDESALVGVVMVKDGVAAAWMNLRHVHAFHDRLVSLWLRHAARHAPFAVLDTDEMAALLSVGGAGGDRQQA